MKRAILKQDKGFSLVELIIVIAIMAILAAAIVPAVVQYIDKSRKAMDVQTAQVIYNACELAMTSGNDAAYEGWDVCVTKYGNHSNYPGRAYGTRDGYGKGDASANSGDIANGTAYNMRPVAWCRGVNVNNWQNTLFKSTIDTGRGGNEQRAFTDEMLVCMAQDGARGGHTGNRNYDGETDIGFKSKFRKGIQTLGDGVQYPECWIIYRRDDNGFPEVWVGYKRGSIKPIYRIFPEPAKDFK